MGIDKIANDRRVLRTIFERAEENALKVARAKQKSTAFSRFYLPAGDLFNLGPGDFTLIKREVDGRRRHKNRKIGRPV